MGAAPRGGPARRWAARPARPRRRAPAPRSLPRFARRRPAPPGGVFAPLRAALGRLRLLPAPSSGALARRRSGAASPRLGALCAPVLASLAASGSRSAARGPPRASCAPVVPGARWALVPAPAGPPCRAGWCWGLGRSRRLPARGLSARCAGLGGLVPRPRAGGLARCGAPPRCGGEASAGLPRPRGKKSAPIRKVVQSLLCLAQATCAILKVSS